MSILLKSILLLLSFLIFSCKQKTESSKIRIIESVSQLNQEKSLNINEKIKISPSRNIASSTSTSTTTSTSVEPRPKLIPLQNLLAMKNAFGLDIVKKYKFPEDFYIGELNSNYSNTDDQKIIANRLNAFLQSWENGESLKSFFNPKISSMLAILYPEQEKSKEPLEFRIGKISTIDTSASAKIILPRKQNDKVKVALVNLSYLEKNWYIDSLEISNDQEPYQKFDPDKLNNVDF